MSAEILPLSFMAGAVCFGDDQPGWSLLAPGNGDEGRTFAGRVSFERRFSQPPVVHVGITGFDIDKSDNARLQVGVTGVDAGGFDVQLRTWWNSRLWSVHLNWIAIGH